MTRRTRKRVVWGAAGVVVLALFVLAFLPKPVAVDTETVERGEIVMTVEAEGKTRVRDLFLVTMPVTGELTRVVFREGDRVTRGTTLAMVLPPAIDPAQERELDRRIDAARAAEGEARAAAQRAASGLDLATREHERVQRVVAEGGLAQQDADRAAGVLEQARAEVAAARSRIDAAAAQRSALQATRRAGGSGGAIALAAPVDGQILRIMEQHRRTLPAGTPVMAVGDARGIEVVIDVLSSDAPRIKAGDRVMFDGWGGDELLHGTVRTVEPSAYTKMSALGIEEQRVNVVASVDRPPLELGDGYRVDARIVLWESRDAVTVPTSALFREEGANAPGDSVGPSWYVFVIEQGRARRRRVDVGHRNTFEAEVLGGLKPGDVVITHPSDQVAEGVRVEG